MSRGKWSVLFCLLASWQVGRASLLPQATDSSCLAFLSRSSIREMASQLTEAGSPGYIFLGTMTLAERHALRQQVLRLPSDHSFDEVYARANDNRAEVIQRPTTEPEREIVREIENSWGRPLETELDRALAPKANIYLAGTEIRNYGLEAGKPAKAMSGWHEDDGGLRLIIPLDGVGPEHKEAEETHTPSETVGEGQIVLFVSKSWSRRFGTKPFRHRTPPLTLSQFKDRRMVVFDFYLYPREFRKGDAILDPSTLPPELRAIIMGINHPDLLNPK